MKILSSFATAATLTLFVGSASALSTLSKPSSPLLFLPILGGAQQQRNELKAEILQLAWETERGLTATAEQQNDLLTKFEKLESLNPTPKPLQSSLVNGVWNLEYTTSDSILGRGRNSFLSSKAKNPIRQTINVATLSAENAEVLDCFGGLFQLNNKVQAALEPESDQFTKVQFQTFCVGPISFDVPPGKFQGALDVTYVDDELRLTRGDKGNIFVLTRVES